MFVFAVTYVVACITGSTVNVCWRMCVCLGMWGNVYCMLGCNFVCKLGCNFVCKLGCVIDVCYGVCLCVCKNVFFSVCLFVC
jgi:hypothetical protein